MRTRCLVLAIACGLLSCGAAYGQNSPETRTSLSGLQGVAIYVVPPAAELVDKGIARLVLSVEVERCLKEARIPIIYPTPPDTVAQGPTIVLQVTALFDSYLDQVVYTIRLELDQTVYLERDATLGPFSSPTWSVGGTGVYADGWRKAIIGDVVSFTGQFVDAYLAANPPPKE
jgi:hypothetical protein